MKELGDKFIINNIKIECPRCGKKIFWEPKETFRPFCSKRCKNSDLEHWVLE